MCLLVGFDVTAEMEQMKCDACKIDVLQTCESLLEFRYFMRSKIPKRGETVIELSAGKFMCMLWRSILCFNT